MQDAFCEQLIAKKTQPKDYLYSILIGLGVCCVTGVSIYMLGAVGILLGGVLLFLSLRYLIAGIIHTEYEYYLMNQELEISRIFNKSYRRDLLTLDIRNAEVIAPVDSPRIGQYKPKKKIDFTSGFAGRRIYSIIIRMDQQLQEIQFEPDDAIIEQMRMWAPAKTFLS